MREHGLNSRRRRRYATTTEIAGEISWSRRGERYASVRYRVEAARLRLIYRERSAACAWRGLDELVPLTTTRA